MSVATPRLLFQPPFSSDDKAAKLKRNVQELRDRFNSLAQQLDTELGDFETEFA